jgi:hypothetical protein
MRIKAIVIFLFSSITLIAQKTEVEQIGNKITEPNNLWNGVSIDVIITISIFITGLIVKYLYDFYKEKNRLKSIKKYFIKLIKSLYDPIEVQYSSYNSLSNNIGDFKKFDFPLVENPDLNIEGFKQVSQYDFYKSIVTTSKKKIINPIFDAFISTVNIIKSIELQKEFAVINYKEFTSSHREYTNEWNSSLEELLHLFSNLPDQEQDDSNFIIEIKSLIMGIGNIGNDKELIYKKIIDPLYNCCNKYSTDKSSAVFLETINSVNKSYKDIKNLRYIYSKLFNDFSNKLNSMQLKLITNLKVFEKKANN